MQTGFIKLTTSRPGSVSGIRITEMRSIKPPDSKSNKEREQEELRAQLHKEIKERSKLCEHRAYECLMPVLIGREYCAKHILDDPTAPYKQCAHSLANGEKCLNPAPITQPHDNRRDQGLCYAHARAALLARQRSAAPPPPVVSTEALLCKLQHYVKPERVRTTSCASSVSVVSDPAEQDSPGAPHAVDPFKQMDAVAVNSGVSTAMMECASASDSDADSEVLGRELDDSDYEETDYDRHPLRYAGIFTVEEAIVEAKTAMEMLQSAYVNQMERLNYLLKDARATYLKSLRAEKEQYCSINSQARNSTLSVKERRQLRKLKAYASYHKKYGAEAVLARKLHHRRAALKEPNALKLASVCRCTFSEGGVRCNFRVLPAAKFCQKHILCDKQQVLFAACGDPRGCGACREPQPRLPLAAPFCRFHTEPPLYASFSLKKEDSDTESEMHSEFSHTEDVGEHPMEDKSEPPVGEGNSTKDNIFQ